MCIRMEPPVGHPNQNISLRNLNNYTVPNGFEEVAAFP